MAEDERETDSGGGGDGSGANLADPNIVYYDVTMGSLPNGSVSYTLAGQSGNIPGGSTVKRTIREGESGRVTARPAPGFVFAGWDFNRATPPPPPSPAPALRNWDYILADVGRQGSTTSVCAAINEVEELANQGGRIDLEEIFTDGSRLYTDSTGTSLLIGGYYGNANFRYFFYNGSTIPSGTSVCPTVIDDEPTSGGGGPEDDTLGVGGGGDSSTIIDGTESSLTDDRSDLLGGDTDPIRT